ncbi:MAG: aminotransferase class III-fold pyridoxal phosphate-dependent enzyme [Bryobacterales bacterium]
MRHQALPHAGVKVGGASKSVIISYTNAFHGRTLGSQQAGGIPALKLDREPRSGLRAGPVSGRLPLRGYVVRLLRESCLAEAGVDPANVAGVMLETYQGGDAAFAPPEYMQKLRAWCDRNKALLVCDEVRPVSPYGQALGL